MQEELKKEPEKFKKEPIGGWLMVMVVFIAIGVIFGLLGVMLFLGGRYNAQFSQLHYGGAYLYNLAYTGLSIIALILIHQRKRSAVPFLTIYYAISIIEGLVNGSMDSSVTIRISSILWIFYLWISDRVKRTFTQ